MSWMQHIPLGSSAIVIMAFALEVCPLSILWYSLLRQADCRGSLFMGMGAGAIAC